MKKKEELPARKKQFNSYLAYSGLAFQMVAVILLGIFIGSRIDRYLSLESPIFTLVFSVLFIIVSIVIIVRRIMKN